MKLIEEFMVLANVAAAEALEKAKTPLIYRGARYAFEREAVRFLRLPAHPEHQLRKGRWCKPAPSTASWRAPRAVARKGDERCGAAQPGAGGFYDPANIGHFGLNLAKYAHFTSPIRRYADRWIRLQPRAP